jgi:transcriptional regulator with XRE-family HTH domain
MKRRHTIQELHLRLRQAREAAGLSQGQVAKLLKMHRPTVTEIENGSRAVSAGELKAFSEIYRTSTEWLLGEEGPNERVRVAARKLESLKSRDFEAVMRIIESLHKTGEQ